MTHLYRKDATLCRDEGAAVMTLAAFVALPADEQCRDCLDAGLSHELISPREWSALESARSESDE